MSRIDNLIEIESKGEVRRDWVTGLGGNCLMDTEFLLGVMKKFLEIYSGDGCITL